ncbi:hypothetical protein S7711_11574 [Stachybotrys chartarum IBT 7711]|uniref:Uncharacterized protein n=1 Tax=Stachybotrys chartarum (strain CBS 109288 / IBT 7711) TaxID=1280523 RepID=A0A084B874_STACB|nr:hypothetical protein S7711_11574 [Stachybotrys chartarum IBT 7711]
MSSLITYSRRRTFSGL